MVRCHRCGATLDLAAVSCPYCGTQTAHGYALEQQRAAQNWHAQANADFARANERLRAEEELKKQGRIGVITGALAFVFCCTPLSVVALVLSLRTKSNASRFGLIAPASSTFGLVLGIFGTLMSAGTWISSFVLAEKDEEKRAELERRAAEPTLTSVTACKLAEDRLRTSGFGSEHRVIVTSCNGRFAQRGDEAFLDGVRFRADQKDVDATVCFARRSRWEISEVRGDQRCAPPR